MVLKYVVYATQMTLTHEYETIVPESAGIHSGFFQRNQSLWLEGKWLIADKPSYWPLSAACHGLCIVQFDMSPQNSATVNSTRSQGRGKFCILIGVPQSIFRLMEQ
jgi:hypothetical protein